MDTSWIFLSFPLSDQTPSYGDGPRFEATSDKELKDGDSCNTMKWSLPNHIGTHIDAPRHFNAAGLTIDEYAADFWVCQDVGCIETSPILPGELISFEKLPVNHLSKNIEILLIKTGFTQYRNDEIYWLNNPSVHPNIAHELRKRFPRLKMIGLDTISLSSFANRELGRKAHRSFLKNRHPLLIIEDMNLTKISSKTIITQIIVAPIIVECADGAPCTVIAEVN